MTPGVSLRAWLLPRLNRHVSIRVAGGALLAEGVAAAGGAGELAGAAGFGATGCQASPKPPEIEKARQSGSRVLVTSTTTYFPHEPICTRALHPNGSWLDAIAV